MSHDNKMLHIVWMLKIQHGMGLKIELIEKLRQNLEIASWVTNSHDKVVLCSGLIRGNFYDFRQDNILM